MVAGAGALLAVLGVIVGGAGCGASSRSDEPTASLSQKLSCWGTVAEVGTGATGTSQCNTQTGAWTLTSSKIGVLTGSNAETSTQDNMLFVQVPAVGNTELVVKLTSFSGPKKAQAGVAIRENVSFGAKLVAGMVWLDQCTNCAERGHPNDQLMVAVRTPARGHEFFDDAPLRTLPTENPPAPLYLRLQRVGNDVAIARSKDKTIWVPLVGKSGGAFAVSGTPAIGFFVTGSDDPALAGVPATATFEVDYQGPVRYPAATSFTTEAIGATVASHSTGFISRGSNSIYVGPDGSVYKTNNAGDDHGSYGYTQRFKDHALLGSLSRFGAKQAALAGDGTYVYLMNCGVASDTNCKVERFLPDLTLVSASSPVLVQQPGGLAVSSSEGYASEVSTSKIIAMNRDTFAERARFDFPPTCGTTEPGAQPGPLAVDESERLWVLQPSVDYPIAGQYDLKRQAQLYCLDSVTGACCGKVSLGSGSNPSAIVYDAAGDRLLITDSGQSWQNVRIFSVPAAGMPVETTAFGQPGGVYSGATPGLLVDAAAGDGRRFYTPTGVGIDQNGAIYVASGRHVDIRKFSPGATTPDWGIYGLIEGGTGDFDPDPSSDGGDFFTTTQHFRFDPSGSTPDSRFKLHAITWNPFAPESSTAATPVPLLHEDNNRVGSTPMIRRINGQRFMYTTALDASELHVHRFHGEQAVRCARLWVTTAAGGTKTLKLWKDANLNGQEDDGETDSQSEPAVYGTLPGGGGGWAGHMAASTFSIDASGDIWVAFGRLNPAAPTVLRLRAKGVVNSVPSYSLATTDSPPSRSTFAPPWPFEAVAKVFYDREVNGTQIIKDDLYVIGHVPECSGSACAGVPSGIERYSLPGPNGQVASGGLHLAAYARYSNWSTSPQLAYVKIAPSPPSSGDFVRRAAPYFGYNGAGGPELQWDGEFSNKYMSVAFAGDKLFFGWQAGPIHAIDGPTGDHVAALWAGPELSGWHDWQDAKDLTHVTKRSNGEYLVTVTDTVQLARGILMRWNPTPVAGCLPHAPFGPLTPAFTGTTPADGLAITPDGLTAYVSSKQGSNYDLYKATRGSTNEAFSALTPLGSAGNSVNTASDERAPTLSADGLTLYYTRRSGNDELYRITRTSATEFENPQPLTGVNSTVHDQDPFFLAAQNAIYFSSERPGGSQRDMYVVTAAGTVVSVTGSVSHPSYEDYRPVLSADGLRMYFASNRSGLGGDTGGDVFMAERSSPIGNFGSAVNIASVNSSGIEFPVTLSADGCTLYVASNRDTGLGNSPNFRLYQATRGSTVPASATVTLNVAGSQGSITTSPFNCSTGNVGTCSGQGTPGSTQILVANRPALWTGSCTGNNGNPSGDGVLVYTPGGTCTVTFP